MLGVKALWRLQEELIEAIPRAIRERKPIYVASGHSLGKDYILARISLWFLQTFRPSIVIQTAPTDRQVHQIMWKETQTAWQAKAIDLGGKIYTEPRLEIDKDWFLTGFTTKETGVTKEGGGGKFQGAHCENIAVIATEAQAIEDEIYDQIDAVTTSKNVLIVFAGNPLRTKGRFATGLKDRKNNIVFNFSCLENPNYLERRTVIPGLAEYGWVENMREKWGTADPRWYGRVLGQTPPMALNAVFDAEVMEIMKTKHGLLAAYSANRGVAVDASGEGEDDAVFMSSAGGEVVDTQTQPRIAPSLAAIRAVEMCRQIRGNFVICDCDGVGIAVYQELEQLPEHYTRGITFIKFHGSSRKTARPGQKRSYANLRAQAAFIAKERGIKGIAAINPRDSRLVEEIEQDEFFENNAGEIQLIEKEDIKANIGRSPGRADCWKMLQYAHALQEGSPADDNLPPAQEATEQPLYGASEQTDNPNLPGPAYAAQE